MTSFQIEFSDYDHIPYFDGKPHNLLKFVTAVRQIKSVVCGEDNTLKEINEKRLLSKVLSRITEDVSHIYTTGEFKTIEDLLGYLERSFRDSSSIEKLTFDLVNTKIGHNEHPLEFISRLDRNRTLIISKYKIDRTVGRDAIINSLEKLILYIFNTNMPFHVRSYLMTKTDKLKTLDDLRNLIQNEYRLLFDDLMSNDTMYSTGSHQGHDNYQRKKFNDDRHKFYQYRSNNANYQNYNSHQDSYQTSHPRENIPHYREWTPKGRPNFPRKSPPGNFSRDYNSQNHHNYQGNFKTQQRTFRGPSREFVPKGNADSLLNRQPTYQIESHENPFETRLSELENQIRELRLPFLGGTEISWNET